MRKPIPSMLLSALLLAACTDEPDAIATAEEALTAGHAVALGASPLDTTSLKTVTVACPAGYKVTGAGWGAFDGTGTALQGSGRYSHPLIDGSGWVVEVHNETTATPWLLRVEASCIQPSLVPGYTVTFADVSVSGRGVKSVDATCPANTVALGGGHAIVDKSGAYLDDSGTTTASFWGGPFWTTTIDYEGAAALWTARGYAVCAIRPNTFAGVGIMSAIDPGTPKSLSLLCAAGSTPLSVGFAAIGMTSTLGADLPASDLSSWSVRAYVSSGAAWQLREFLYCSH
jgi:hypothetical protein